MSNPLGVGRRLGSQPRANTSMTIMRAPQRWHGERSVWLDLKLDEVANEKNGSLISTAGSKVRAWVIPTNEEIMIARHTLALVDKR